MDIEANTEKKINIWCYDQLSIYLNGFLNIIRPKVQEYNIIITPILVLLNIIFFVSDLGLAVNFCSNGEIFVNTICSNLLLITPWGALDPNNVVNKLITLFSYSLHHLNFAHIFMNSVALLLVGCFMEKKYGPMRILILYLIGVLGSGFLLWWWYLNTNAIPLGASGGIYGIMSLFLSDLILNPETVKSKILSLIIIISVIISLIIECVIPLNIAVGGHIGGTIASFSASICILPHFKYRKYDFIVFIFAGIIFTLEFIILPTILYVNQYKNIYG